jgi:hypothetical protein
MSSPGILRQLALVKTNVSEDHIASIIRVIGNRELGTSAIFSSETSVPAIATRRNIPGDDILQSHRPENLKSCIA